MGDKVLFAACEEGHNHIECFKVSVAKWEDFYELGKLLREDKKYTTIIIDTVDFAVRYCEKYICDQLGVQHPSDLSFGKGFAAVKNEFIRVMNGFNKMGYSICFISHSKSIEQKTKVQTLTVVGPSLSATWSELVTGMADIIFYLYIDSEGQRKMRTKPTRHIIAGERGSPPKLPAIMDVDFDLVQAYLNGDKIADDITPEVK